MARLNALEWADGLSFVAYGMRIGLRVTDPETLPGLMEKFPPAWRPAGTRRVQWLYSLSSVPSRRKPGSLLHQLYTGGSYLTRGSDFSRIARTFGTDLRVHLSVFSPSRVFIHAGAVGWRGRAIIIPGSSGTGKTRMTAALVKAGATLLSDEYALLDRKGRVHPYPLPLRMKKEGRSGAKDVTAGDLGGQIQEGPLPVGLVLSTHYQAEATTGGMRGGSAGRTALTLMAHAVQARLRPERVMEVTAMAAQDATFLQGPRGEAVEMVDTLLNLW